MKELDTEFKWESETNASCDLCKLWTRHTKRLGICGLTRGLTQDISVCNEFLNKYYRPRPNEEK